MIFHGYSKELPAVIEVFRVKKQDFSEIMSRVRASYTDWFYAHSKLTIRGINTSLQLLQCIAMLRGHI